MSTSVPSRSDRKYDVVVFGATGYTGRLVATCFAEKYGTTVRWAMAGRNRAKLESVRDAIAAAHPNAANVPLLIADNHDRAALDAIVRDARCVATTAGPFLQIGLTLAEACAENGTDYCDLTGEVPFVRKLIDNHHESARRTGARVVPCCGFDSIPSDMGVRMMYEAARERDLRLSFVNFVLESASGGFSGGTIASMKNMAETAVKDPSVRRILGNPYALDPAGGLRGLDGADQRGARFDQDLQRWTGPFIMAATNTRVVRRSNALLDYAYGRDFRYSESMAMKRGPLGAVMGAGLGAGMGLLLAGMAIPFTRNLLMKRLPAQGEGPSEQSRVNGHYRVALFAHTCTKEGSAGPVLRGTVSGQRDPGYGETAWMLTESALCLAHNEAESKQGGVLTTASAHGMPLIKRLRTAGMKFEVEG